MTRFGLIWVLLFSQFVDASMCSWQSSQEIGKLDVSQVNESSGIAVSKKYSDRVYHVNDSGDGPYFYETNLKGENTVQHEIQNFKPKDVEDLSVGPCGKSECLYIADIGDNLEIRPDVTFLLIKEKKKFGKKIKPFRKFKVKYPDQAHNAEAIAIHPNGDLYLVTKEMNSKGVAKKAQIYMLSKKEVLSSKKKIRQFKHVGELDIPTLASSEKEEWGKIITAMSFSSDGKRVLLLTYRSVIELNFDFSKKIKKLSQWKLGVDYQIYPTESLPQQEVVDFLPGDESFIYTTEYKTKFGKSPIYQVSCKAGAPVAVR